MKSSLKTLLIAPLAGLVLGGCSELTEYFGTGDPAEVSSCAFVMADENLADTLGLPPDDTLGDLEGVLCVECNSGGASTAEASYCGAELKVRCNSDLGYPIYGIAIGAAIGGDEQFFTASAWEDKDDVEDDFLVCHSQSGGDGAIFGKQEWKCTNALTGNGKGATTFEVEVKYDESKDDCAGPG